MFSTIAINIKCLFICMLKSENDILWTILRYGQPDTSSPGCRRVERPTLKHHDEVQSLRSPPPPPLIV